MQILRNKCDFQWVTPSSTLLTLPINCANNPGDSWPWRYFKTQTTGDPPQTQGGFQDGSGSFSLEAGAEKWQTVLRGIFAYVATDPIGASITMSVSADPPWDIDEGTYSLRENRTLLARLYSADGGLLETYIDSDYNTAEATITLPATVCPKVLWLGAAIQPTGRPTAPPYEPSTTASITFSS
jgi:hypothetical protein